MHVRSSILIHIEVRTLNARRMFREKPVLVSALKAASEAVSEAVSVFSGCMDHNPYPVTTQEAYPVPVTKNPYSVSRIAFLGIPMPRIPYPYYKFSAEPLEKHVHGY